MTLCRHRIPISVTQSDVHASFVYSVPLVVPRYFDPGQKRLSAPGTWLPKRRS
jgi:hypothetical protein